jgi:hypothetical protein
VNGYTIALRRGLHYVDGTFQPESPRERKGERLAALHKHAELYMSDAAIATDFESVLALSQSEDDTKALKAYRRARMSAHGYNRHSHTANSHRQIPLETLRGLTETTKATPGNERECASCGVRFLSRRKDARFCGGRCRQRNHTRLRLELPDG